MGFFVCVVDETGENTEGVLTRGESGDYLNRVGMSPRVTLLGFALLMTTRLTALVPIETLRIAMPHGRTAKLTLFLANGTIRPGNYMSLVAFSKSTTLAAEKLIKERQWIPRAFVTERFTPWWVLVAVRAGERDPLFERFGDARELLAAAKNCDNDAGDFMHLYLYVLSADDDAFVKVEYYHHAFSAKE